jgi:KUP system potassium uptake protein
MSHSPVPGPTSKRYLALSTLTALGVVYGDIGTSPLYALRECFHGPHAVDVTRANVLGVLSLVTWAMTLVVSIKYCVYILRADNRGEGGILSLASLVVPIRAAHSGRARWLLMFGLFGAALLYGDGVITPAISVLSALEGLEVATPFFAPYVVPLTIAILVALFVVQKQGTARMGIVFGPIIISWFLTLAALGLYRLAGSWEVLAAVNPIWAWRFFAANGFHGFVVLGSVFLVATGAEALYADMGHFGRLPIRLGWFSLVMPALLLNYFGQGALILGDPAAAQHPFYRLGPAWTTYPLVALATAATVIASQAVISGAYSLTRQAVQLGYTPRLEIEHTSARERGQIYVPAVNWALMFACIALVLAFRTASNLAAAYGIAVTSTMVITTVLFYFVVVRRWGWKPWVAALVFGLFLAIDLAFLGANALKIAQGGWFPLALAAVIFTLMATWKAGRRILAARLARNTIPLSSFLQSLGVGELDQHLRVQGTAVYMHSNPRGTPPALLHNLKHNHTLHETVLILTVETQDVPRVDAAERLTVEALEHGFYRLVLRYGFMEEPDVPLHLARLLLPGRDELDVRRISYFLSRETLLPSEQPGMALWRESLFAWMTRNAKPASSYFHLPPNRVIELGMQVEL